MSIEKQEDGRWLADVEPVKGKRFRRRFKTKAEAVRFEAMVRERLAQNPDWNLKPKDKRRLSELVARWALLHGHALADGENRRTVALPLAAGTAEPWRLLGASTEVFVYRLRNNHQTRYHRVPPDHPTTVPEPPSTPFGFPSNVRQPQPCIPSDVLVLWCRAFRRSLTVLPARSRGVDRCGAIPQQPHILMSCCD